MIKQKVVYMYHILVYTLKAKRIIYLRVLIERVKENTFAQLYLYLNYDCSQSQYTDHWLLAFIFKDSEFEELEVATSLFPSMFQMIPPSFKTCLHIIRDLPGKYQLNIWNTKKTMCKN